LSGVIGAGRLAKIISSAPWLVGGFETDIQGADLRSDSYSLTSVDPGPRDNHFGSTVSKQRVDWFGTVRGRIGFTPFNPRLLIYGTGGFEYGGVKHSYQYAQYADNFPGVPAVLFGASYYDNTKTGWTAGGGVEYAPIEFPNWSLKAEYLYVDLGKTYIATSGAGLFPIVGAAVLATPGFFVAAHDPATRFHTVRVGLNYRFNLFGAPPVAASY
jgi:opacity protein-like surface antigen